jgi:hypothetical protein
MVRCFEPEGAPDVKYYLGMAGFALIALAPPAFATTYTFSTIDYPDTTSGTQIYGINNAGVVAGVTPGGDGLVGSNGSFGSTVSPLSSGGTQFYGINDSGVVVGSYPIISGAIIGFVGAPGTFNAVTDPLETNLTDASDGVTSGPSTAARGVNNAGTVTGYYSDGRVWQGYLDVAGTFTTITDPLATTTSTSIPGGTVAFGLNNSDDVVGQYYDGTTYQGFEDVGGVFTTIADPSATAGTFATGINDSGQIAGFYTDNDGTHAFVDVEGAFTNFDDPLATGVTVAFGINNAGDVAGYYVDASGDHGFIASPTSDLPEPASLGLFGAGVAIIGLTRRRARG